MGLNECGDATIHNTNRSVKLILSKLRGSVFTIYCFISKNELELLLNRKLAKVTIYEYTGRHDEDE